MRGASWRTAALNVVFRLLIALGILLALLGLGMDFILGTHPGLNLPQLLLIAAGLLMSLTAFRLRHADARQRTWAKLRGRWRAGLLVSIIALLALEFVLAAGGVSLYYPLLVSQSPPPEEAPWWICDELGCRFDYDAMVAACENGELPRSSRHCIVNRQGFHDRQDFTAGADLDERTRILMLGDSFTFGMSADIGKSYVETIEASLPQSIVWNTGIHGVGTQHALAVFQTYAPLLQPHITILGFSMNDFTDNVLPMDAWLWARGSQDVIRRYSVDFQGNVTKLDDQTLNYHAYGVSPPTNEIRRLIGITRLGTLALKTMDLAREDRGLAVPDCFSECPADATREYLQALRDAAAAQDTALLVLLIPRYYDIEALGRGITYIRYPKALQFMEELEMPYLNPVNLLDDELDYESGTRSHWNSAGHQKIGSLLSRCIQTFQISQDWSACEEVKTP